MNHGIIITQALSNGMNLGDAINMVVDLRVAHRQQIEAEGRRAARFCAHAASKAWTLSALLTMVAIHRKSWNIAYAAAVFNVAAGVASDIYADLTEAFPEYQHVRLLRVGLQQVIPGDNGIMVAGVLRAVFMLGVIMVITVVIEHV